MRIFLIISYHFLVPAVYTLYEDDEGITLCNTFIIFSQFTLSNAFSKSTRQLYTLFSNSRLLSHIILMTNCISRTTTFSKSKLISPYKIPGLCLNSASQNFEQYL